MKKIKNKKRIWKKLLQRSFTKRKRKKMTIKNFCSVQDIKCTHKEIVRFGKNSVKNCKFHSAREPHGIN